MNKRTIIILYAIVVSASLFVFAPLRFATGATFINIGYFFQDGVAFSAEKEPSPRELLDQIVGRNKLSSSVRKVFPRSHHHPLVAMVACMDGRLHTEEIVGDTRGYYYVIRTAGSILELPEIEMLELAVVNGVKLILLTTHSDCAAEKVSKDVALRMDFPNLSRAVDSREQGLREFLKRPIVAEKIRLGQLLVYQFNIDTLDGGELK